MAACKTTKVATVKQRNLAWFGQVTSHDSLRKIVPQGTLKGGHHKDITRTDGWTM
ncbi:hypothetical protein DPMN_113304 [Dreissena polymorpha]|uniref:Uncharacterized protein n=1 Tax=Dreissena polymorpha TaxID=45954 RepID=A0A9D4QQK1_DREPO|nr:hypothetical protein DPMN_113304 [Dreissena polymorpha]